MTTVLIRGDGVAARCCAHLLTQSGASVTFQPNDRPRLPAIMLGDPAQALIQEIFGRKNLFQGLPRIRNRIVAWAGASTIEVAHSAVVVSEEWLLGNLVAPAAQAAAESQASGGVDWNVCAPNDWTVFASRPLPAAAAEHRFGSRMATARQVELSKEAEAESCWIESVDNGWLFLIANAASSGWLLSVGSHPDELLQQSRMVRKQIAACPPASAEFAASPQISEPFGEPGWIACGTAAVTFDPICGDGAAHAIREAILASAVIAAAARGEGPTGLLAHYQARLTAAFGRHLSHCLQYYGAVRGSWWESEAKSVSEGIEWCRRRLSQHTEFHYRLDGFELQRHFSDAEARSR